MAPKTTASKGKGKKMASSSGEAGALPIIIVLHSSTPISSRDNIGFDTTQIGKDKPHYPLLENLPIFQNRSQEVPCQHSKPSSATLRHLITETSLETANRSKILKLIFLFGICTCNPDILDLRTYRWLRTVGERRLFTPPMLRDYSLTFLKVASVSQKMD
ncbi:uncharacterized protein A4U43_C08F19450 [Asparagus officinalis]|nr:uncharacterized protein A4U43_C08F19450 [Asparagus officinalis]